MIDTKGYSLEESGIEFESLVDRMIFESLRISTFKIEALELPYQIIKTLELTGRLDTSPTSMSTDPDFYYRGFFVTENHVDDGARVITENLCKEKPLGCSYIDFEIERHETARSLMINPYSRYVDGKEVTLDCQSQY